jgi:hypothetical protein
VVVMQQVAQIAIRIVSPCSRSGTHGRWTCGMRAGSRSARHLPRRPPTRTHSAAHAGRATRALHRLRQFHQIRQRLPAHPTKAMAWRIAVTAIDARDLRRPELLTHMPDYAQPNGTASIEFQVLPAGPEEIAAPPQRKRVSWSAHRKSRERKR